MKAQIVTHPDGTKEWGNPKRMNDYVNCTIEYRDVTEQEIIDLRIPTVRCEVKIPLNVFVGSERIQQKLAMLNLIYDGLDRRTIDGIIYLSHIDLNDVPQFLSMEEYQLCVEAGVIFDENIRNLYENVLANEQNNDEEETEPVEETDE